MTTSDSSGSAATAERPVVTVDVFSDVVCPWCYIGKRRFERGLELARADGDLGVDFEIGYRPHQLDPTAAPGVASPVVEAYAKKFGGMAKAEEIIDHVTTTAAAEGLDFHMERALRANTLLAHRLIWRAGRAGSPVPQDAVKERLLQAYFVDGVNIGDPDALADTLVEVGIDRDETLAFLDSDEGLAEVEDELRDGYENGITAVPTYVFDRAWAVPGAQDAETFATVLRKMAAKALERAAAAD